MPTEAELAILSVLWERGSASVREVYEALYESQGGGYTTALKMLQVMHGKGLVAREENGRAHLYRAVMSKASTQQDLVVDLVRRVFDGSSSQLVLRALGSGPKATREELDQIRELLDRLDSKRR